MKSIHIFPTYNIWLPVNFTLINKIKSPVLKEAFVSSTSEVKRKLEQRKKTQQRQQDELRQKTELLQVMFELTDGWHMVRLWSTIKNTVALKSNIQPADFGYIKKWEIPALDRRRWTNTSKTWGRRWTNRCQRSLASRISWSWRRKRETTRRSYWWISWR